MTTSKSVPGSACHVNKRFVVHAAHGPTRGRGDARLTRRLYHPEIQPGQALTSSVAPALITCLRWRGFTSECAREGAARQDLHRRHRERSSTCPALTTPAGVRAPQPSSGPALGPSSLPSSSIWCQRATPPGVPPSRRPMCHHTPGRHSPVATTPPASPAADVSPV